MSAACAAIALAAYVAQAAGQAVTVTPRKGDDFRAVYAGAADIAEGKAVAESSCAACHGVSGQSAIPGIPNIAGQRAAYFYLELKAYKTGQRANEAMARSVKFLSDDALVEVSAYYASLEPAPPAPLRGAAAAAAKGSTLQAAEAATSACAGCHGEHGVSATPGMPNLVGQDPKYLAAAISTYKSGQRKSDMMKSMVGTLGDSEIKSIALYYALQKPARAQTPAQGDREAGKTAAAACVGCHGEQGVSGNPVTPSLAGQDAGYFATALHDYKSGARSDPVMSGIAAGLDDRAVKNLAAYYAALEPKQPPNVRPPLSPAQWVERCDRCHGVNGNSIDPRIPALAAQRFDYLEQALRAYQTGARKSATMAAMADVLSRVDVGALAGYYASQRARPVVYVTLPCQ
ncbi:MAG TPA: c-type cytochrome [Burkholderiales bacterium]|nr:c-type cytochrome [Burkholderiales bacterium]